MCIFWVCMFIFLILSFVWSTLKWLKGGEQEVNLTEDSVHRFCVQNQFSVFFLLQDFLQLQHESCSCNTESELTAQLNAPPIKAFKGERISTNIGKHFSEYILTLNPSLLWFFYAFFTSRYLIPVSATHLSRNVRQFFIPSGFLQKELSVSWYVHSACIFLEPRGWTSKMVSLLPHLGGWNVTYLKKKKKR